MRKSLLFSLVGLSFTVLIVAFMAQSLGFIPTLTKSPTNLDVNQINLGASTINFSSWELQTWLGIKNRLTIYNSDPAFTGNRTLQWISMRNSSSSDYYQKSMEYLCFWSGQGSNGEWEAVVSIYNLPNDRSVFVVEVARFTWHELQVLLDGTVMANFPQVTNDTTSLGYTTFRVTVSLDYFEKMNSCP